MTASSTWLFFATLYGTLTTYGAASTVTGIEPTATRTYFLPSPRSFTTMMAMDTLRKSQKKINMDLPGKGLGIAISDFDRDGAIDVAVANDSMFEFLYHNKGNGTFEEIGLDAEIAVNGDGRTYAGMGIDFQDFDNDGLPDLVITDLANEKYALYHNNGDGYFHLLPPTPPA